MKKLMVKALIVLSVILFSEVSVYAHEEPAPELNPLQRLQLFALAEAQITCSAVLIRAFPEEDAIAELGSEIVDKAITASKRAGIELDSENIVRLAESGFDMWDESSEEGRFDLLALCGQEILKGKAVQYGGYMPADTQIFM